MSKSHWQVNWLVILLLLVFWASRLYAVEQLPLHIDEGIHLQTALKVWEGDLMWRPTNGKLVGHWLTALLLPQANPVFIARMATVLVVLPGVAAGYLLVKRLYGTRAGSMAVALWGVAPYLFFFERTALMDAQTGALVVVATWLAVELLYRDKLWIAILAVFVMLGAVLYKLTALPVLVTVAFIVLFLGTSPLRKRLRYLATMAGALIVCVVPVLVVVLPRLADGVGQVDMGTASTDITIDAIVNNMGAFFRVVAEVGTPYWWGLLLVGLVALVVSRYRTAWVMLLAPLPLLLTLVVFSSGVFYRYFAVVLPLWVLLGGGGLGLLLDALPSRRWRGVATAGVLAALASGFVPFAQANYQHPEQARLPLYMQRQYITEFSAGYGLREAVLDLPNMIANPELPVIASMFTASCHRANYYAGEDFRLTCAENQGRDAIEVALGQFGAVYILTDAGVSLDVASLVGAVTQVAAYPRPGDLPDAASVQLWLVEQGP